METEQLSTEWNMGQDRMKKESNDFLEFIKKKVGDLLITI